MYRRHEIEGNGETVNGGTGLSPERKRVFTRREKERLSDNRSPVPSEFAARARASGCSSEWARPVNQESAAYE